MLACPLPTDFPQIDGNLEVIRNRPPRVRYDKADPEQRRVSGNSCRLPFAIPVEDPNPEDTLTMVWYIYQTFTATTREADRSQFGPLPDGGEIKDRVARYTLDRTSVDAPIPPVVGEGNYVVELIVSDGDVVDRHVTQTGRFSASYAWFLEVKGTPCEQVQP